VRNALVPTAPPDASGPKSGRPTPTNADFVVHLIATRAQWPQTRARRRAEPAQAIAAYDALDRWPQPRPGRILTRTL